MSLFHPAPSVRSGTPEVSLLTSANQLPAGVRDYEVWRSGLGDRSTAAVAADARALCATGDRVAREDALAFSEFSPFDVYVVHGCAGHVDEALYRAEAERALEDKTAWLVARQLWTGSDSGNPSFQSEGVDIGGSGPVQNVVEYLIANIEDATSGGQAFVHVPTVGIGSLMLNNYLSRSGGRLFTPTGHVVVPGPGYPSAPGSWGPDGSAAAASGEVWVFATTAVELGVGPVEVMDVSGPTADRQNLYEVYVQRPVLARFDTEFVFAALGEVPSLA